jgi:hypothetical protein
VIPLKQYLRLNACDCWAASEIEQKPGATMTAFGDRSSAYHTGCLGPFVREQLRNEAVVPGRAVKQRHRKRDYKQQGFEESHTEVQ